MITTQEAEALAQQTMQQYVASCGCDSREDIANALVKLISMCGLGMCAVIGQPEAVAWLQGTTDYIAKTQEGKNWNVERAN
jgi:hypothetical protein